MVSQRHRRFEGGKIVIASHNPGKIAEFADLLEPFGAEVLAAAALGLPSPQETGETFASNAELKARQAARGSGLPALADDSGLQVAALDGRPGIHSARWAGPDKDFGLAMTRVEEAIEGKDDRRARFVCALVLCWPDDGQGDHQEVFEGSVSGTLVWPPRGDKGFGYDPVFVADGHEITFGEMEPREKHKISHRAMAFGKLVDACFAE